MNFQEIFQSILIVLLAVLMKPQDNRSLHKQKRLFLGVTTKYEHFTITCNFNRPSAKMNQNEKIADLKFRIC